MRSYIPRTATLSWSPADLTSFAEPLIATGTVSGALDESFSNESILEIWKPDYGDHQSNASEVAKPIASAAATARFNRLSWGSVSSSRPQGLLAAGLESGELNIWDAQKVLDGAADVNFISHTLHTGPVRGLHFNPTQSNLLASGGVNGEVFIWDMTKPEKPYSPGAKSNKLDEITSLNWNNQVPHILATSSSSGYTVVWDLKGKREVAALAYGGGAGTAGAGLGNNMNGMALAAGGRRGMGAVCWHPDTPTRLVTASDDDSSPIIMLWDLRNARAPEKILTGHDKGVLSLSWCKQDSDLLLSCGKDNRTICWNPQTSEIVGELPSSQNWNYDVQWCPKNPDLLATASFDGKVGVHSLQATNVPEATGDAPATQGAADGSDIFNLPAQSETGTKGISLKQPPKWLRKPISATFGFGGQLVSTVNLPGQNGQTQSSVVHIRDVVSEPGIAARAQKLQEALETQTLADFCDERSKDPTTRSDDVANWKALQTLFRADSRDELVTLLGFSKEDVASKVAMSISSFQKKSDEAVAPGLSAPATPVVKPAAEETAVAGVEADAATEIIDGAAEHSVTEANDTSTTTEIPAAAAAAPTEDVNGEASLFDSSTDAQGGADADFFNNIPSVAHDDAPAVKSALPSRIMSNGPVTASAAATAGSPGPSSVTSEGLKINTFRIYPSDESDADKLITRALVLGDFESAVSLCVSADRFADALLLAVRGGSDLLARTQKAYFERRTTSLPYLRLFQSIVSDDLTDIVQNADLNEWQEIFVVLCTFAKADEFASLAEQLGQRLEYQYERAKGSGTGVVQAKQHRKDAVLCYLAAGKLEKVAGMWIDEMKEEEVAIRTGQKQAADGQEGSLYTAHAEALQTFMEKIIVFKSAVNYVDVDLAQPTQDAEAAAAGARTYKLAALYDRIHEYVELLANQGLIAPALKYVQQTPVDYQGQSGEESSNVATARERLLQADAARFGGRGAAEAATAAAAAATTYQASSSAYGAQPNNAMASSSAYAPATTSYDAYGPPAVNNGMNAYAQPVQQQQQPQYAAAAPNAYDPYGTSAYGQQAPQQQQQQQPVVPSAYAPAQPMVPAPPPPIMAQAPTINPPSAPAPAPPAPPPKRDQGGWNDIPTGLATPRRTPSAMSNAKAAPIMSPFPNAPAPQAPNVYGQGPPTTGAVPPPPRVPSRGAFSPPPGAAGNQYGRPPQMQAGPPRPPPMGPPRGTNQMRPQPPPQQQQQQQQQQVPPQQQQQQQQQPAPGPYGPPPGQMGSQPPLGSGFQQAPSQPGMQQGPPSGFARPPPGPPGQPGLMQPPTGMPARAATPGGGAGAPPRTQTPAKPSSKYPSGDRSHVPEAHRPIVNTLSRELQRFRQTTPPAQKRMVDDIDRRVNLLLDNLNCETVDPKLIPGLLNLSQAIDARNQQAALSIHLQVTSSSSGEVAQAMVGVKQLIQRMQPA